MRDAGYHDRQLDGPQDFPWTCERNTCQRKAVFCNFFYDAYERPRRLRTFLVCESCQPKVAADDDIEWVVGSRYARIIYPDINAELTTYLEVSFAELATVYPY